MTFALTGFKTYGIDIAGDVRPRARQVCELRITAANTDTALDLDAPSGTFWTAALADATYSGLATTALRIFLTDLPNVVSKLIAIKGEVFLDRIQVASGSLTNYVVVIGGTTAHFPAITFYSGSAPTAYTVVLDWCLDDSTFPLYNDLGAAAT